METKKIQDKKYKDRDKHPKYKIIGRFKIVKYS